MTTREQECGLIEVVMVKSGTGTVEQCLLNMERQIKIIESMYFRLIQLADTRFQNTFLVFCYGFSTMVLVPVSH